jgi:hypothetical protein
MSRCCLLAAVYLAANFLLLPLAARSGEPRKGTVARSCPAHCGHRHRLMEPPPHAPVVASMAAPMMSAAPVAFLSPMQGFAPAQSPIRPETLRALANMIEAQQPSEQAGQPSCNGSGSSAMFKAPQPPPDVPSATQKENAEARISSLETRVERLQNATDRLLDRVEELLKRSE